MSGGVRFLTNPYKGLLYLHRLARGLELLWKAEAIWADVLTQLRDTKDNSHETLVMERRLRLRLKAILGDELIQMHSLAWPGTITKLPGVRPDDDDPAAELEAVTQDLKAMGFSSGVIQGRYRQSDCCWRHLSCLQINVETGRDGFQITRVRLPYLDLP